MAKSASKTKSSKAAVVALPVKPPEPVKVEAPKKVEGHAYIYGGPLKAAVGVIEQTLRTHAKGLPQHIFIEKSQSVMGRALVIGLTHDFQIEVEVPTSGDTVLPMTTVDAGGLRQALRAYDRTEQVLLRRDGDSLQVSGASGVRIGLKAQQSANSNPRRLIPTEPSHFRRTHSLDLEVGLFWACEAASDDITREVLTRICFTKDGVIAGVDCHRLHITRRMIQLGDFTIHRGAADAYVDLANALDIEDEEIVLASHWPTLGLFNASTSYKVNGQELSVNVWATRAGPSDFRFPEFEQLVPKVTADTLTVMVPTAPFEAAATAGKKVKGRNVALRFNGDGTLDVVPVEWVKDVPTTFLEAEKTSIAIKGQMGNVKRTIGVDPRYLLPVCEGILNQDPEAFDELVIRNADPESPLLITGGNSMYQMSAVIMPIRLAPPKSVAKPKSAEVAKAVQAEVTKQAVAAHEAAKAPKKSKAKAAKKTA